MSVMAGGGSLTPTWTGYVATARDALILFEACLSGQLHHVPRRPHDRERASLIRSGSVFIYEENASGIKRWTDGVPWSPSRILGNFLVYRELLKAFPPGEKKRATKKSKRPTKPGEPYARNASSSNNSPTSPTTSAKSEHSNENRENSQRALIGSLTDSYGFKDGGLVKKTMSVNLHGVSHHLVSYYTIEDVNEGVLTPPSQTPGLKDIVPRHELVARQSFRVPLDETIGDNPYDMGGAQFVTPSYSAGGYGSRPNMLVGGQPLPTQQWSSHGLPMSAPQMHSYAAAPPVPSSQSYYPPSQGSHDSYHPGYQTQQRSPPINPLDRRSSHSLQPQPQQQQYYARPPSLTPLQTRPMGNNSYSQPQEQRSYEAAQWDNNRTSSGAQSAVYSTGLTHQASSTGPYSAGSAPNSQWNMLQQQQSTNNLPRMDGGWNGGNGNWNMDHESANRHNAYQGPPPKFESV